MKQLTTEERLQKIENWLTYEGGNYWSEAVMTTLRYAIYFSLAYVFLSVMWSQMAIAITTELPNYCKDLYGNF